MKTLQVEVYTLDELKASYPEAVELIRARYRKLVENGHIDTFPWAAEAIHSKNMCLDAFEQPGLWAVHSTNKKGLRRTIRIMAAIHNYVTGMRNRDVTRRWVAGRYLYWSTLNENVKKAIKGRHYKPWAGPEFHGGCLWTGVCFDLDYLEAAINCFMAEKSQAQLNHTMQRVLEQQEQDAFDQVMGDEEFEHWAEDSVFTREGVEVNIPGSYEIN